MKAKAAITNGDGNFFIDEIEIGEPGADEVLVKIGAAGICHTDWDSLSWGKKIILGHEGAGTIECVGEDVTGLSEGDHVVLNWAISCGQCYQCRKGNYSLCESDHDAHEGSSTHDGEAIGRSFSIGTMSSHTIVKKEAVTKIEDAIPFGSAAISGCGVMTGYGSVLNVAKVEPGSSVVVVGCGGVGLNVIQGARISGAAKIIAIDLKDSRLQMAKEFGATHTIKPEASDSDLSQSAKQVKSLTGGRGGDYAFECTGLPKLGAVPLLMVRNAGMAVQVSGIEEEITIDMNLFEWDKIYINPLYGKCNPPLDFPKLFTLYKNGQLKLDELVTSTYSLEELDKGFQDMHSGKNAKGVILF